MTLSIKFDQHVACILIAAVIEILHYAPMPNAQQYVAVELIVLPKRCEEIECQLPAQPRFLSRRRHEQPDRPRLLIWS